MDVLTILLVDDDPDAADEARELAEIVRAAGAEVNFLTPATNGADAIRKIDEDGTVDAVLLDWKGIADPIDEFCGLISDLRARNPDLPIVLFSMATDLDVVEAALDAGASHFITKDRTEFRPYPTPASAAKRGAWLNASGNRLYRLSMAYRSKKWLRIRPRRVGWIRKVGRISPGPDGKRSSVVMDQAEFLKQVSTHAVLRTRFVEVVPTTNWDDETHYSYEMPLYRHVPLRRYLFEAADRQQSLRELGPILDGVIDFVVTHLYPWRSSTSTAERTDYVRRVHFEKFRSRMAETRDMLAAGACADPRLATVLDQLLDASEISLGTRTLRGAREVVAEIEDTPHLVAKLIPPLVSSIHGDLHFDNILVDPYGATSQDFVLIDPRGWPQGVQRLYDPAYDYGKLLHSSHGLYDLIHVGAYRYGMKLGSAGQVIVSEPSIRDWIPRGRGGGGSGDDLIVSEKRRWRQVQELFEEVDLHIRSVISSRVDDENWELRASFHEAMHFLTMAPFHLQEDTERAVCIWLRGLDLINRWWDSYGSPEA